MVMVMGVLLMVIMLSMLADIVMGMGMMDRMLSALGVGGNLSVMS